MVWEDGGSDEYLLRKLFSQHVCRLVVSVCCLPFYFARIQSNQESLLSLKWLYIEETWKETKRFSEIEISD